MSRGSLTPSQRMFNALKEAIREAEGTSKLEGLIEARDLLLEIDPEADTGEHVPGRVYGPTHDRDLYSS